MYKFTILNANEQNDYAGSKMFKEFGGCEATIRQNYFDAGRFYVYTFNYGYEVALKKN